MSRVVQGIIQGVMAGISFIGAGVILRNVESGSVEGLTTAAGCAGGAWKKERHCAQDAALGRE